MLTSKYPAEHGVMEIGQPLGHANLTLAEILGKAGYRTAAVSANPVAGPLQGLDQGFETFVDRKQLNHRYGLTRPLDAPVPAGMGPAEAVTAESLRILEEDDPRPLFLWLLYMDPHWDYNPPAPFNEIVDWQIFDFYKAMRRFPSSKPTVYFDLNGRSSAARRPISKLYDAEIRYTDAMIGHVMASIAANRAETLLILTSDHGESLGEHGYFYQHGALAYQPCMHIPMIFSQPGRIPEGTRIDLPVSNIDLVPTILSVLGIPAPPEADFSGLNLSPILLNPSKTSSSKITDRIVTGESGTALYPENPLRAIGGRDSADLQFVRDQRWALVQRHDRAELFDHTVDPMLTNDVSADHPELVEQLLAGLDRRPLFAGRWRTARDGRFKAIRIPEAEGIRWELYDLEEDPLETTDIAEREASILDRFKVYLEEVTQEAAARSAARPASGDQEEIERQLKALGYIAE